ncbi:MAG: HlyD family efflux transporter periplasmic adaptor subunit, partial [Thiotrichaceae bacterium]|nr:HlyD family efflux transporter periplasmic adaptor subunit [Thiotrichaceae bacterium]
VLGVKKEQAKLELENTQFIAPFDLRITQIKINQNQYANKGQLLFSADAISSVEVEARFPIGKLRPLMSKNQSANNELSITEKKPGAISLDALVRLKTARDTIEWPAQVDRVSGIIDLQTQTLGVVVVVDNPYQLAQPGKRPPLIRNTFVEVELAKKAMEELVVIPISAIHNNKIYIVDNQQRLQIRNIKPMFIQNGVVAISKGLEQGETLVVSKLIPAIEGMLLKPIEDKKALKQLKMAVMGKKRISK